MEGKGKEAIHLNLDGEAEGARIRLRTPENVPAEFAPQEYLSYIDVVVQNMQEIRVYALLKDDRQVEFTLLKKAVFEKYGPLYKRRKREKSMCLAVPSRIVEVREHTGIIEVGGTTREVNLMLIEDAKAGDYVIVHAGFAIQKIDESEALETLKILHEAAMLEEDR